MPYLKCIIKFLFRQLSMPNQALNRWLTRKKRGKDGDTKFEYLKNEKSFLDEIKNIFHSF